MGKKVKQSGCASFEVDGGKMSGQVENANQHKRNLSLGSLAKDRHEDLSLFQDMQKQELSNFLHLSNEEVAESLRNENLRSGEFSEKGCNELLIVDPEKSDYDWLVTPPETPLFPSLDREVSVTIFPKQHAARTVPSHASKSLGGHSSFSTKTSKSYPGMKRSSSFSTLNNERSSTKSAPSKGTLKVRSQPSTPTRSARIRTGEGHVSYPKTYSRVHLNGKVTSSGGYSPSIQHVSPSKKPQTPYQEMELSFSSVPPPNLRTSMPDRSGSRYNSSPFRHKRNASVARIRHSTWMESNSHLRLSTVSKSLSVSCSSSASLNQGCFSPNSSSYSGTSPFEEVNAPGRIVGVGPDRRRMSRSYDGELGQFSTSHLKETGATSEDHTSFSDCISSALQSSSRSNSVLNFAARPEKSESCGSESKCTHGDGGLFRDMNNFYMKQLEESSFVTKKKDDMQTESYNIQNYKENLNVSYASDFSYLLESEGDPLTHEKITAERENQDHFLQETSETASVDEEQPLRGGWTRCIDGQDNVCFPNVSSGAQLNHLSEKLNRQNIPKLWAAYESDAWRPIPSIELMLNLEETKSLEKLEQCPTFEVAGGENFCSANPFIPCSKDMVLDKRVSIVTSFEEPFPLDLTACSFEDLKNPSFSLQSSSGLRDGTRDVLSGQKMVVNNVTKELSDPIKISLSHTMTTEVCPTLINDESISTTSEGPLLIQGRGVTGIMVQDGFGSSVFKADCFDKNNMHSSGAFCTTYIDNGKDNMQFEFPTFAKATKTGDQSLLSSDKHNILKDQLIFGTGFSNRTALSNISGGSHHSLTDDEVKGLKSSEKYIQEGFANHGWDSSQHPGLGRIGFTDFREPHNEAYQSYNKDSEPYLETEKELALSRNCMNVECGTFHVEDKFPVTDKDTHTSCNKSRYADDKERKDTLCEPESPNSEQSKETPLAFDQLSFGTMEMANMNSDLSDCHKFPSVSGDDSLANTTTSTDDDHRKQAKHETGPQPLEPITDTDDHLNSPQSGEPINYVSAPSTGDDTAVSASPSSLWQNRGFMETADAILFCSSIVHDLLYKASTIAAEKEESNYFDFRAAAGKDIPLLCEHSKKRNANAGKTAKSCKSQAVQAEQITRQKLLYMQQQNRINSTVVSHLDNSGMQIDVKQQEEHVQTIVNNTQKKELPSYDKPKCSCIIL